MLRPRSLCAALALSALSLAGCNTPSIPIPPPEPGDMTFALNPDDGTATYKHDAVERFGFAIVYVYNEDSGQGVIDTARADGSVGPTAPFDGIAGDRIIIAHQVDDQLPSVCVILANGRLTANDKCP